MATTASRRGVILYGPPASGKDTITQALHDLDNDYELFPRLKVGPGRTSGYHLTSTMHLNKLRQAGRLLWETSRYDATYDIDRDELLEHLERQTPVLHLGQRGAIAAVRTATPGVLWCIIELWTPRDVAEHRLIERRSSDIAARLAAWDDTERLHDADLSIDTARESPDRAARKIKAFVGIRAR